MDARAMWTIFVEDGGAYAAALCDGVAAQARRISSGDGLDPIAMDDLGAGAYRVATIAYLMGCEEIGRLAQACEQALERVEGGADPRALLPLLAAGAEAIASAFGALARPDASGARTEVAPLDAARAAIEQVLGATPEPDGAADLALTRAAAGAARAAAATAQSAAAAAAASAVAHLVADAPSGSPPAPAPPPPPDVWTPTVDDDMIDLFFEEADERLEGLAQKLVQLEERPDDADLVREIFRDLHTVKGSSGMVGLLPMNQLAHAAEDLVGQVRDGARKADRAVVDALLAALDALRTISQLAAKRAPMGLELGGLLARLKDPGNARPPEAEAEAEAGGGKGQEQPGTGTGTGTGTARGKQTLRVDFDKLDLLLNLVGELVLGKAGLQTGIQNLGSLGRELEAQRRAARKAGQKELGEELSRVERVFTEVAHDLDGASGRLDHVSAELRDQVMKLRMLPIAGVFRKYHRTVRDLARALGKEVRLELSGEETELDKVLVEQLDDPLMHLVRNAVDHGIEPPEARRAAGKAAEGAVRLSACHRGNQIVIEIADDGGGIDPAKLRKKAREKQLVADADLAAMDDKEVLDLIFRPGFSTASRVSEVSGRGVGMDVVRNVVVQKLKGQIDVDSRVGQGTTFTLKLPLTLAIIQVLLARVAGEIYAVPLDVVTRTLTCRPSEIRILGDREVLAVRDAQVPLVRVADALALPHAADDADDRAERHVILVEVQGDTFGLVVERLLGKQEIVMKTLGELLEDVPGAAGATLLGDRCAIILDVPAVISRALRLGRPVPAPAPAPGRAQAPARPRILLVEDSDVVRESLRRLLEGQGYAVTCARDGAEGLRLAQAGTFDLVSTDVMMPRMDGYELTRALRATEAYRDAPIVMVTSRGEKIDRVRGFDAGVDEYITKPHDPQELLRAIAKHLGRGGA